MKFYVITDEENGMKITWKNLSMRFSHSGEILPVDCLWGHFSDFNVYSTLEDVPGLPPG